MGEAGGCLGLVGWGERAHGGLRWHSGSGSGGGIWSNGCGCREELEGAVGVCGLTAWPAAGAHGPGRMLAGCRGHQPVTTGCWWEARAVGVDN